MTWCIPASENVQTARDAYLRENGFTIAQYDAKWTPITFLGLEMKIPNTKLHARAIRFHDLHHVATGYGTDLVGEAEISAWELRGGLRGLGPYVAGIIVGVAAMGVLMAPRKMWKAWKRAGEAHALWTDDAPVDELLALNVGELRARAGVPPEGMATAPGGFHAKAPANAAASTARLGAPA